MPRQSEAKRLADLTEVPAGWPLAAVIDAFLSLTDYDNLTANGALQAVSHRLGDLWVSQPAEAEAWLQRCREVFAKELAGKSTGPEELQEALLRHGAAEYAEYVWAGGFSFTEAGLLRGEPRGSAAERERVAALYLQAPLMRDRCRELAERLAAAESRETARKQQKLEEETSERRRIEAELCKSQEEGRELSNRLAAVEAEVRSAQSDSAGLKEQCEELTTRAAAAESVVAEIRKELGQLQGEHGECQERCEELVARLEAEASKHAATKERLSQAAAAARGESRLPGRGLVFGRRAGEQGGAAAPEGGVPRPLRPASAAAFESGGREIGDARSDASFVGRERHVQGTRS